MLTRMLKLSAKMTPILAAKSAPDSEYATLYSHFADLLDRQASDADPAPLGIVADAFLIADLSPVEPYYD